MPVGTHTVYRPSNATLPMAFFVSAPQTALPDDASQAERDAIDRRRRESLGLSLGVLAWVETPGCTYDAECRRGGPVAGVDPFMQVHPSIARCHRLSDTAVVHEHFARARTTVVDVQPALAQDQSSCRCRLD